KEDVMSMSRRILKEYGDRTFKSLTDPKRSAHELGIPLVKAMQLVACSELGRRYFSRRSGSLPVVRTAAEAFEQLKDMASLNREHLRGLYLNSHYQVIHDEVVSIGTVDVNITHPREVFRPALEYGAAAVIIAHNHPSGMLKPSDQDIAVTEQLVEAGKVLGIRLLDHLIISADGFASVPADYSL
ncbi:MAG TPA: DNA repair protein RadC, partial [Candidatus Paceibacterota bacterium]|nr:DNA repair protein RadC [Candidatus Paceibacterota bacterium]